MAELTSRLLGRLSRDRHPSARTLRRWVPDVLLTLLILPTPLPYLHRAGVELTGVTVGLVVAGTLPILVRRIWPAQVLLVTAVISAVAVLADARTSPSLAVLVALYTVSAYRPLRIALPAAALIEAGGIALAVREQGSDWWYGAIFLTGLVAAALALGLYSATRSQYLEGLRERARRLEYERDQQSELSAAAERARIAREMHDIVAHHLTVIVTLGDAMVAAPGTSPERTAEVMKAVSATARQALGDTRRLLGVLRDDSAEVGSGAGGNPGPLPDLAGLDDVIGRVRAAGVQVVYEVSGGTPDLPNGLQLTVYRLVQEALTNTLKHAGSGAGATVRISYLGDAVQVDVRDDGGGLPTAAASSHDGRGLIGMRERVQAFDGQFTSGPVQGGGWSISARLPLDVVGSGVESGVAT